MMNQRFLYATSTRQNKILVSDESNIVSNEMLRTSGSPTRQFPTSAWLVSKLDSSRQRRNDQTYTTSGAHDSKRQKQMSYNSALKEALSQTTRPQTAKSSLKYVS